MLADAIAQVTGVPDQFTDRELGTRAVQLVGTQTPSYALDVLGRCLRERSCEAAGRSGGGLAQALHLINGSTINGKLRGGVLDDLLARDLPPRKVIEELFLRALSRPPTVQEQAQWEPLLTAKDKTEAAEDLLWVLLNSRELAFNH